MPGRDGSGPQGQGSKTGRGMGNCSGTDSDKKHSNRPFWGGRWHRRNYRHQGGNRFRFRGKNVIEDPDSEKTWLEKEAELLRDQLDAIEKRISDLS